MPADPKQIRTKLLAMAQADVRKGALSSALRRYKRLTGLEPTNPSFHLKLGDLALKLGKQDEARAAYLTSASLFCLEAFEEKALAVYRRVLEIDPVDLQVWGLLSDAYQRVDRAGEAIVALRAAVKKLLAGDHRREAMQLRRKIATLDPGNIGMRLQLAHDLGDEQMPEEAVFELVECILRCAAQREWDRIPSTFEALVAMRPAVNDTDGAVSEEASDAERCVEGQGDEADEQLDRLLTSRRYEDALHDMYRRMSELGREQIQTLAS